MEQFFPQDEITPESEINFHFENITFELNNTLKIKDWLFALIEQEGYTPSLLNFIFCSDEYLHKINLEYLQHDTYTDIITFPMADHPLIGGEIFISIDRVSDNAQKFGVSFPNELHRVMAHGVLHLCGYPDKTEEEAAVMRRKENEALDLLISMN